MKQVFTFCSLLLTLVAALPAFAQFSKRPGPSAVQAARLKKFPPNNYLAHYLPDDRYKIAGGVWKFVSTDLDTYYHIPSSRNMLRQSASRVIGFANAKEAEDAGYLPDPTDGTAERVANSPDPSVLGGNSAGAAEVRYFQQIVPIFNKANADNQALGQQIIQAAQARQNSEQITVVAAQVRQATGQMLKTSRTTILAFEKIRPPVRLRRFHSLMSQAMRNNHAIISDVNRLTATGNLQFAGNIDGRVKRHRAILIDLFQEMNRLSKR